MHRVFIIDVGEMSFSAAGCGLNSITYGTPGKFTLTIAANCHSVL